MRIETFELERFFAKHEFSAEYLLSSSDCETMSISELAALADSQSRELWKDLRLGYTETKGHPALREAVAELYPGLGRENILVVAPEEGIFLLMQALLNPGDHVVCTFPGYQSLYALARSIGCEVSLWTPDEDQGWHFSIRRLDDLIREHTKLVVVNFPHNPTGSLPAREEYDSLLEIVSREGAWLFSDEMYSFLELDPEAALEPACKRYAGAVSLFGLSKSFGLPGLRIGWVASRDRGLLDQMSRLRDYTTICNSAPSEILGLMAVRGRDRIIAEQRSRIEKNILLLDRFFENYSDCFHWNRPQSGSICFPRMKTVKDTFIFCENLVRDTGVMLAPSRMFDYGDHHVRFGFGRDDLSEGLMRLSGYLDTHVR